MVRIEKAKELLGKTRLSLLEIAQLVGYSHQSSLTRLFKKVEGLNPLQYRINVKTG
jgi:YesN/AraC family two-component response regulator